MLERSFGNPLPLRQSRNIGRIGPQTLALLDSASREQIGADMTVEIAGYEGQWFDADDVQGYLEERGVFIDPSATFAEVEIDMDGDGDDDGEEEVMIEGAGGSATSLSPASSSAGLALAPLGTMTPPMTTAQFQHPLPVDATAPTQWVDLFPELTDVGFSDAQTGSWMNFLQPGEAIKRPLGSGNHARWPAEDSWMSDLSSPATVRQQQRKKKIVIDVRKLVKGKSHRRKLGLGS